MDRWAQMFIAPDEFDTLVARIVRELNLHTDEDERYVYVGSGPTPGREAGQAIRLERPRKEGNTLYKVQHGVRTNDSELVRIFDRIRRQWSGTLSRPVRATSIPTGESQSVEDIGFTAGALALYETGWKWRQEGVENVAFGPDDETARREEA